MDDQQMLEKISSRQRDLPEGFHQRMDTRLHRVIQAMPYRRSRRATYLRVAMALVVFIAAGAFALQQTGLLSFREPYMTEAYYFALPEAQELVHPLEAAASFEGWKAELREVLFDGRWLKVLYAVTDQRASEPFTSQQKEAIGNGDLDSLYQLYGQADAYPSTETSGSLLINGKQVNIHNAASGAGDNPGEYLFVVDSELEPSGGLGEGMAPLRPEGVTQLTVPFTNSQGVQVAALTARFDAGDAVHRYARPLPEPVQRDVGRLVFYDLFVSPANVVLQYGIRFAPTQSEQAVASLPKVQLVNARGEPLGTGKDGYSQTLAHPDGTKELRYHLTSAPAEEQGQMYLLLPDGTMVAIDN